MKVIPERAEMLIVVCGYIVAQRIRTGGLH